MQSPLLNPDHQPTNTSFKPRISHIQNLIFLRNIHIAARGQYIKRWSIPRTNFPEGREGYHQWRRELTNLNCLILSELMKNSGYLKYYVLEFSTKHSNKNISEILLKAQRKMSNKAIQQAIKICPTPIIETLNKL